MQTKADSKSYCALNTKLDTSAINNTSDGCSRRANLIVHLGVGTYTVSLIFTYNPPLWQCRPSKYYSNKGTLSTMKPVQRKTRQGSCKELSKTSSHLTTIHLLLWVMRLSRSSYLGANQYCMAGFDRLGSSNFGIGTENLRDSLHGLLLRCQPQQPCPCMLSS